MFYWKFLSILIFFFFFSSNFVSTQNSSDCMEMYKNSSTDQKCLNATDCCYYEYDYNGKNYKRCVVKLNHTDNICRNFSQIVMVLGGSWTTCSCFSFFLQFFSLPITLSLLVFLY